MGWTPLCNAIDSDSPSFAQILIRHGADVNAKWSKYSTSATLLFEAVRRSQWAVNLLLENGANPQADDGIGQQVLDYAVETSQESMVKVLLDHGGLKDVTVGPTLKATSLHLAVSRGKLTIIEMILKAGADTNEKDQWGNAPLHRSSLASSTHLAQIVGLLLKFGAQVNLGNHYANTPLHLAVYFGRPDVVQMILDTGPDPNLLNSRGETAWDVAQKSFSRQSWDPRRKEILKILSSRSGTTSFT